MRSALDNIGEDEARRTDALALISTLGELPAVSKLFAGEDPSLAVLPFVDLGDKHSDEYFAEGLTEAVITSLAAKQDVRVVSLDSAGRTPA